MVAAIDEALASSVIHTVQENRFTSGTHERWYDEQTGAVRDLARGGNGQPVLDVGRTTAPDEDDRAPDIADLDAEGVAPADPRWPRASMRHVDHCFATYADVEEPVLPGGGGPAARTRDGLADGSMVIDGTELVEGRELIRVVAGPQPPTATGSSPPGEGTSTVPVVPPPTPDGGPTTVAPDDTVTYVDPDTYRPVMVVDPGMYTQRLDYLPRTPQNLARLVPPVPEGFAPAGALHGDRERHEANCSS